MDQSDEKEMDFEEDEVGTVDSEWEFLLHKISDHSELVEPEEDSSDEEEDNPSHSLNRVDHVSNQREGQALEEFDQKEKEEEYRLGHNDEKKDQGRKREVTKTRWGEEDCLEERVMAKSASEVADEEANFQYVDEEVEYVDEYIDEEAEEETETYCSSVEHDDKENSIDITYDGASEQCSEPSMVSNEWDGANGEEGLTMEEVKRIALREEATEDNQVLNGHDTGCEAEKRKQTCQSKHSDAEPGYDQCNAPLETVGFSNISEVSLECTASVPYASISQSLTVGDEDQRLCTRSSSTCKINQDLLLKSEDFDPEDSEGNQLSDDQFQSKKRHSVHQKEDQFLKDEFVKLPLADKTLISFQKNDKDSDGSPPAKKFKLEFEIKTSFEKTEESKKADLDTDLLKGCLPMAEESTQLVSRLTGGDSLHKLKDPVEQLALSSTSGNYETELFADMSSVDIPVDISGKISEDEVVTVKDIFETEEMEFDLAVSPLSNVSEKMTMHSINQFTADDSGKECSDAHAEDECCHNTRDKQSDLHSETYTNKPDNVDFSLTNGDTSTYLTDHSCHQKKSEEKQVGHFDCSSSSAIEYAPEENEKMCQNERKDANLGYLEEKFPSADTKDVAASSISDRQPLEDAMDIATSQISATQLSEDATDIATSPISATQPLEDATDIATSQISVTQPSEDATDIATSPISATQPSEDAMDIATSPISATQPSEDAMDFATSTISATQPSEDATDIATSTISATQPPEDAADIATSPVPDTQSSENSKDVATTLDGQDLIDAKDIATSSVTDTQPPENTPDISKSLVSDTQSSEDSKGVATTLDTQYSEDAKDCEISLASETQPSNAEEEIPHVLEVDKSTQMWADIEAQRRQGMLIGVSLQPLHKTDLPKLLVLFNEVSSDYEIYMRGGRTKGSAFLSMSQTSRMKDLMNGLISVGSLTNRFLFWGLKNISLHPGFEVFCTLDLAPKKPRRSDMIRQVTSDSPDREMYEVSFGDLPAGIPSVTFKDLFPMALGVQYDFEKSDRTKKQCALSIEGCQLRLLFASEKTMYQCLDLYVHICVNGRNLNSSYSGFWRSDQCLGAVTVPAAQEVYRIPRGVNVTYYYLRAEKNDQRITYPTVTLNPAAAKSLQRYQYEALPLQEGVGHTSVSLAESGEDLQANFKVKVTSETEGLEKVVVGDGKQLDYADMDHSTGGDGEYESEVIPFKLIQQHLPLRKPSKGQERQLDGLTISGQVSLQGSPTKKVPDSLEDQLKTCTRHFEDNKQNIVISEQNCESHDACKIEEHLLENEACTLAGDGEKRHVEGGTKDVHRNEQNNESNSNFPKGDLREDGLNSALREFEPKDDFDEKCTNAALKENDSKDVLKENVQKYDLYEISLKDDLREDSLKNNLKEDDSTDDLKVGVSEDGSKEDTPKSDLKKDILKSDLKQDDIRDNLREDVPKGDLKEDSQKDELKDDVSKNDRNEECPNDDLRKDVPKGDLKEDSQKDELKDDVSKNDHKEECPTDDLREDVPKVDLKEDSQKDELKDDVSKNDQKEECPKDDLTKIGSKDKLYVDDPMDISMEDDPNVAVIKDGSSDAQMELQRGMLPVSSFQEIQQFTHSEETTVGLHVSSQIACHNITSIVDVPLVRPSNSGFQRIQTVQRYTTYPIKPRPPPISNTFSMNRPPCNVYMSQPPIFQPPSDINATPSMAPVLQCYSQPQPVPKQTWFFPYSHGIPHQPMIPPTQSVPPPSQSVPPPSWPMPPPSWPAVPAQGPFPGTGVPYNFMPPQSVPPTPPLPPLPPPPPLPSQNSLEHSQMNMPQVERETNSLENSQMSMSQVKWETLVEKFTTSLLQSKDSARDSVSAESKSSSTSQYKKTPLSIQIKQELDAKRKAKERQYRRSPSSSQERDTYGKCDEDSLTNEAELALHLQEFSDKNRKRKNLELVYQLLDYTGNAVPDSTYFKTETGIRSIPRRLKGQAEKDKSKSRKLTEHYNDWADASNSGGRIQSPLSRKRSLSPREHLDKKTKFHSSSRQDWPLHSRTESVSRSYNRKYPERGLSVSPTDIRIESRSGTSDTYRRRSHRPTSPQQREAVHYESVSDESLSPNSGNRDSPTPLQHQVRQHPFQHQVRQHNFKVSSGRSSSPLSVRHKEDKASFPPRQPHHRESSPLPSESHHHRERSLKQRCHSPNHLLSMLKELDKDGKRERDPYHAGYEKPSRGHKVHPSGKRRRDCESPSRELYFDDLRNSLPREELKYSRTFNSQEVLVSAAGSTSSEAVHPHDFIRDDEDRYDAREEGSSSAQLLQLSSLLAGKLQEQKKGQVEKISEQESSKSRKQNSVFQKRILKAVARKLGISESKTSTAVKAKSYDESNEDVTSEARGNDDWQNRRSSRQSGRKMWQGHILQTKGTIYPN